MTAPCEHIIFDNLRGNECELTGASVTADCGDPVDRPMQDAGECIPRLAFRYLRGDRATFATLGRADREVVMATATRMRERMKAGLIRREDAGQEGRREMETDMKAVTDLTQLSAAELRDLAIRARAQAREKEKAEKQAAAAIPALEEELDMAQARVLTLERALAELRGGKPVHLSALGVKLRRGRTIQVSDTARRAARKGVEWTPERRAAQGERMKALLAKARAAKKRKKPAAQRRVR